MIHNPWLELCTEHFGFLDLWKNFNNHTCRSTGRAGTYSILTTVVDIPCCFLARSRSPLRSKFSSSIDILTRGYEIPTSRADGAIFISFRSKFSICGSIHIFTIKHNTRYNNTHIATPSIEWELYDLSFRRRSSSLPQANDGCYSQSVGQEF